MKTAKVTDPHINVRELSEKLKKVSYDYPQNMTATPYTFYFIDYLNQEYFAPSKKDAIYAEDLLLAVQMAFNDLRMGFNMATGKKVNCRAADRVSSAEIFIRLDLAKVWEHIFTPEFAAEAKRVKKDLEAKARRYQVSKENHLSSKSKHYKTRKK